MSDRVSAGQGETAEQARPDEESERRALLWLVDMRTHGGPLGRLYATSVIDSLAWFEQQVERLLVRVQEAEAERDSVAKLTHDVILDLEDTCDCDDHREQIERYRTELETLGRGERSSENVVATPDPKQEHALRLRVRELTDERDQLGRDFNAQALATALRVQEAEWALRDLAEADGINKPTWRYPWMRAQEALARLGGDGQQDG